jgi:hypothetical protein
MRLHVGLTAVMGSLERYSERFDLLEMRVDPEKVPSNGALKKMRSRAPKLVTSFFLPARAVASVLTTPEALTPILAAADVLGASWCVLQTGTELGPSQRNKDRLAALSQRILSPSRRVAWEPHGLWDDEASAEYAQSIGISLVQDLSVARGTGPEVVYTRLRSLGPGAALRSGALDHLAIEVGDSEEVFIVIEGRPSLKARSRIERVLASNAAFDDEGEEDDDTSESEVTFSDAVNGAHTEAAADEDLEGDDAGDDADDEDLEDGDEDLEDGDEDLEDDGDEDEDEDDDDDDDEDTR